MRPLRPKDLEGFTKDDARKIVKKWRWRAVLSGIAILIFGVILYFLEIQWVTQETIWTLLIVTGIFIVAVALILLLGLSSRRILKEVRRREEVKKTRPKLWKCGCGLRSLGAVLLILIFALMSFPLQL